MIKVCFLFFFNFFVRAENFPTGIQSVIQNVPYVFLMEAKTGRVLLTKNPDERMHPSSMTKIVPVMLALERIRSKTLSLEDTFPVSVKAWKQQGSRMFLNPNTHVSVFDLLMGAIIQSGNDACVALAEGLRGSEEEFAQEMTEFAKKVGANNTHFSNSSGLPDPEHYSTARDLATLGAYLIKNYPEFYPYFSQKDFTYNSIRQGNRNPLLYKPHMKADGIKTGSTDQAGYGILASAERNGVRLILVLNGLHSMNHRSEVSEKVLDWGFKEFKAHSLFKGGEVIETAPVWLGQKKEVTLIVPQEITMLLSQYERSNLKAKVTYSSPLPAPISKGTTLGNLEISIPGQEKNVVIPLIAGDNVPEVGVLKRCLSALNYIIWGS